MRRSSIPTVNSLFSDFPEDVLSVPTEELAVEDAYPGQRPLHDAKVPVAGNVLPSRRATSPSPSEVQVLSSKLRK